MAEMFGGFFGFLIIVYAILVTAMPICIYKCMKELEKIRRILEASPIYRKPKDEFEQVKDAYAEYKEAKSEAKKEFSTQERSEREKVTKEGLGEDLKESEEDVDVLQYIAVVVAVLVVLVGLISMAQGC